MEFNKKRRSYYVRVLFSLRMYFFYIILISYLFFLLVLGVKNYAGDIVLTMSLAICALFSLIEQVHYIEYIGMTNKNLIIKAWKFDKLVINQEYDINEIKIYIEGHPYALMGGAAKLIISYKGKKISTQLEHYPWSRESFLVIKKEVERISPLKYIKY